jgi:hypothetical protein
VTLLTVTDEELAALDPLAEARLVPLERYDRLEGAARVHAYARGLDSLVRRGLLDLEEGELAPAGALAEVVAAQDGPRVVAVVSHVRPAGGTTVIWGDDDGGFLEQRASRGRHRFVRRTRAAAERALVSAVDARRQAQPADDERAEAPFAEVVDAADGAARLVRVDVVRRGGDGTIDEAWLGFAAGPGGVWLLPGGVGRGSERARVEARPVGPETLRAVAAALLAER